jgi:predicted ATPase with chaperone activity
MLNRAVQQLQLSARAYHRVLKLARTIADLERWGLLTSESELSLDLSRGLLR